MPERPEGKPDEAVWLGIRTNKTGRVFQELGDDIGFLTEYSHGDGFGGLTDPQINVYRSILQSEIRKLDGMQKGIKPVSGNNIPIQRVGQG